MSQSVTRGQGRRQLGILLTPKRFALTAAAVGAGLVAVPGAQAATNVCSKVSPSAISAIVGHSVPPGVMTMNKAAPSKKNFGIGGVSVTCTYGKLSATGIKNLVLLDAETTNKPITVSELQQTFKKTEGQSGIKIESYSGLGVPGVYFTLNEGKIHGAGISGIDGTHTFGAAVYTSLPQSKLAALAKLAKSLN